MRKGTGQISKTTRAEVVSREMYYWGHGLSVSWAGAMRLPATLGARASASTMPGRPHSSALLAAAASLETRAANAPAAHGAPRMPCCSARPPALQRLADETTAASAAASSATSRRRAQRARSLCRGLTGHSACLGRGRRLRNHQTRRCRLRGLLGGLALRRRRRFDHGRSRRSRGNAGGRGDLVAARGRGLGAAGLEGSRRLSGCWGHRCRCALIRRRRLSRGGHNFGLRRRWRVGLACWGDQSGRACRA